MSRFTSSLLVLALVLSIAPLQIQAMSTTMDQARARGMKMSNGYTLYPTGFKAVSAPATAQRGLKQDLLGGVLGLVTGLLSNILGGLGSGALLPTSFGGQPAPSGQSLIMTATMVSPSGQSTPGLSMLVDAVTAASGGAPVVGKKLLQSNCPPIIVVLNRQPLQAGPNPLMSDDIIITIKSSQGGLVGSLLCTVAQLLQLLQIQQLVFALNKILAGLPLALI